MTIGELVCFREKLADRWFVQAAGQPWHQASKPASIAAPAT
jgi:hypothetical protein